MNDVGKQIPQVIAEHKDRLLWRKAWLYMHRYNKMFSVCICGKPGSGKSWLAMSIADLLDRTADSGSRFDILNCTFGVEAFTERIHARQPAGSFLLADDAGLSMYSREAMMKSVRDITKIFMSCRYLNRGIVLTLPNFKMLDSNVRRLVDAYIEVTNIDYETQMTTFKFMFVGASPFSGDVGRRYPLIKRTRVHPSGTVMPYIEKRVRFSLKKPSDALIEAYEKKKVSYMDNLYKEYAQGMRKDNKKSFADALEAVKKNKDKYVITKDRKQVVDWGMVLGDRELGIRDPVSAKKICQLVNK